MESRALESATRLAPWPQRRSGVVTCGPCSDRATIPAAVATLEDLLVLDVRVGTIVGARPLRGARRPMLALTLALGALGQRQSCVDSGGRETGDDLVGLQVAAVVNLPPRRVAGFDVDAQILAVNDLRGESVLLLPERPVEDGVGLARGLEAS